MRTIPLLLVLSASLALLSGCGQSPSEPREEFNPVGSVSFSYQGSRAGVYHAAGEMQLQSGGIPQLGTGATAFQQENLLSVFGFRSQSVSRGDFFSLVLGEVREPGSFPLDPLACQQQAFAQCRSGFFIPDLDPAEFRESIDLASLADRTYVMVLGNVTVTARTPMRVRGTFQGVAFRANTQVAQNMIIISAGQFDLPVRPQ
jgi:hypothetical protein